MKKAKELLELASRIGDDCTGEVRVRETDTWAMAAQAKSAEDADEDAIGCKTWNL